MKEMRVQYPNGFNRVRRAATNVHLFSVPPCLRGKSKRDQTK